MKHSTLWIFLIWCIGISLIGLLFIDTLRNMIINTKTIIFVILIDIISIFSVVWLGISRWIVDSISTLKQEAKER